MAFMDYYKRFKRIQMRVSGFLLMALYSAALRAQSAASDPGHPTMYSVLVNAGTAVEWFVVLMVWGMYATGLFFIAQALLDSAKKTGQQGTHISGQRILSRWGFAGLFLGGGTTLSLFKTGATGSEEWIDYGLYADAAAGSDPWSQLMLSLVRFVQLYGAYAMLKGMLLWKSAADGQDRVGEDKVMSGTTHVFFGGLCADCVHTYRGIAEFLDFPIPEFFPAV